MTPTRDPVGSTTLYEQFLLGTHRRCHIINLGTMGLVVLVKKMFKWEYVIDLDHPTRDPLGSKIWYEQFLSGTPRRCQIWSLVKTGRTHARTDGQKFLPGGGDQWTMIRGFKWCLGKKSKKKTHKITLPYSRPLSGAANKMNFWNQTHTNLQFVISRQASFEKTKHKLSHGNRSMFFCCVH